MLPGQLEEENGVLNPTGEVVSANSDTTLGEVVSANSDTTPPGPDFSDHIEDRNWPIELTPEERKIERDNRILEVFSKVLPKVKALKIGDDPRHPWLSNPNLEATVKATIEVLYDLQVSNNE